MRVRLFPILMLVAASPGCKRASDLEKRPYDLGKLEWLVGSWSIEDKRMQTSHEEHWIRPDVNLMLGLNRTMKQGKTMAVEHLQIVDAGETIVYTAWPGGQEGTSFRLTGRGDRRAIFENPAHDFPQRILYWRDEAGLHAELDGTVHGQRRRSTWLWQRTTGLSFMTGRTLTKDVTVAAPRKEVWAAWTTKAGVKTFFAPEALIEPIRGGRYELHFDPEAPRGKRGSEGCIVVESNPESLLVFTWNFPPTLPSIRDAHTIVRVRFLEQGPKRTKVSLEQMGWQAGEDWEQGYQYFLAAWSTVLDRLKMRFAKGPIDWSKVGRSVSQVGPEGGDKATADKNDKATPAP